MVVGWTVAVALAWLAPTPAIALQPASEVRARGYVPLAAGDTVGGLGAPVTLVLQDVTLLAALRAIAERTGASLALDPTLPGLSQRITLRAVREPAAAVLLRALRGAPVHAMVSPTGQIVVTPRGGSSRTDARRTVGGTVRIREDGAPLGGARVELVGTRFTTTSRDDGAFSLGQVPVGTYALRVTRIGFRAVDARPLHLEADGAMPLDVRLERAAVPLSAVVVTPGWFGGLQPGLSATASIPRQRFETVPHFDDDVFRAATRLLPGLAAGDFASRFTVRGGSADELYVTLDGLELAEPYHLQDIEGGLSLLDVNVMGGLELTTGGFTAEYGDRLTGVLTMRTVDPAAEGAGTSVGVSMLNTRVTSRGTFAAGRGGWLASARRGYLDLILRTAGASDSLDPTFYDVFAKVQRDLPRLGRVTAHVLHAGDRLTYLDVDDPSLRSRYASTYGWLTWEGELGARLRQRTVASVGRLRWRRDGERVAFDRRTAEADDRRRFGFAGLRQDWQWTLGPRALLKFGGEARREGAGYEYASWVDDARVDRTAGVRRFDRDSTRVDVAPEGARLAVYVAPRVQPLPSVTLEAGLRVDRATAVGATEVAPRLNASWEPMRGTTLRAAWGRHSQSQALHALQAADGVARLAAPERAEHRVLGLEQTLAGGVSARVEAYERRLSRQRPRFVNWTAATELFPEIEFDRIELRPGAGRARGLEMVLARSAGARTDWSASYALASATDRLQDRDVPRALDQRHAARADWSYHPASNRWRLSLAGTWHSGWPYTPTLTRVDTLVDTPTLLDVQVERAPGAIRSARVPAYRRVDARWTRYVDTRRGRLTLYAEVYNVLGTRNVRSYFTNVDVQDRVLALRPGSNAWLPRLPAVGASWDF
jgi:hypothetical protein